MSAHPIGVFNSCKPFRRGPPAPLYRSGLVRPTRSVVFMAEVGLDAISETQQRVPVFQIGVFTGLYRLLRRETVLTPSTRRFANVPLRSSPDENPANEQIDGRLLPVRVDRTLEIVDGRFAPMARSTVGAIRLLNQDGNLDTLDADVAMIGRRVDVKVGTYTIGDDGRTISVDGSAIADAWVTENGEVVTTEEGEQIEVDSSSSSGVLNAFGTIFSGTAEAVSWEQNQAQITARDPRLVLERPVQTETYSGSGAATGNLQLAGLRKPKTFGFVVNCLPQLIDPVLWIYQYHTDETQGVQTLRIAGLPTDLHRIVDTYAILQGLTPPGPDSDGDFPLGTFADCPMAGCFRLANPPAGLVTADIRGAGYANSLRETFSDKTLWSDGTGWTTGGRKVHSRTATDVILRLFDEVAEFTGDDVSIAQITQLGALLPYEVGVYLQAGAAASLTEILALLADSLGALLFRARNGKYQLRLFEEPNEVPLLTIRRDMIVSGTLQRITLPYRQPWSDWELACEVNHHPMNETDFVEAVVPEDRQTLARENVVAQVVNRQAASIYKDRAPIKVATALVHSGDAMEVGGRLASFYSPGKVMFELQVKGIAYQLDLLDTVRVIHPRYGLALGRNFRVVAVSEDGDRLVTTLRVFGGATESAHVPLAPPELFWGGSDMLWSGGPMSWNP